MSKERVTAFVAGVLTLVSVGALASCGDDEQAGLPPGAAIRIGDQVISKQRLAEERKTTCLKVEPARGSSELRIGRKCDPDSKWVRAAALTTVILGEWESLEAKRRGLTVDFPRARRAADTVVSGLPGGKTEAVRALGEAGISADGIFSPFKRAAVHRRLEQMLLQQPKASPRAIRAYYQRNRKQFFQPEQRVLRLVLTTTKARALRAKADVVRGDSWDTAVRRHSTAKVGRDLEGRATFSKGGGEPTLLTPVFSAQPHEIKGPFKVSGKSLWFVFEVTRVQPEYYRSLKQATPDIETQVNSIGYRFEALTKQLTRRYRGVTTCAPGIKSKLCESGAEQ